MSQEINVISRTQTIIVEPTSKSVSIIWGGPQGPPGSGGGGASHYEDLFGTGYDATGPDVYDGPLPTSFPAGSDWTVGPWYSAGYPYWYPLDEGGGGAITVEWGVGDPNFAEPDPIMGTDPGKAYFVSEIGNDNYGNMYSFTEWLLEGSGGAYADLFMSQTVNGGSVISNSINLQSAHSTGTYNRILLITGNDSYILLNARPNQTVGLLTLSGGVESGAPTNTNVMLQVVPHPSTDAGVRMGYMRTEPVWTGAGTFVGWVDETNNKLKFLVGYKDGSTFKRGEVALT